jgi:aminoglycoside phosphotransferase (APT) family kinase protein
MKLLHDGQININIEIVKTLIKDQFPQFNNLPISEFDSIGTVNSLFRLGNDYYVRLPILQKYENSILKEDKILTYLQKKITIKIPQPIGLGKPCDSYPCHWAIHKWIDGDYYDKNKITNFNNIVHELVNFINELHSIDLMENTPKAGRKPLAELNTITIDALSNSKEEIDYQKALKLWEIFVNTSVWDGKPVWIHADLLKPNILVKNNHIKGIIDFGSAGIGDPAFDIIPAWAVFDKENRNVFREKLKIGDTLWNRACAYALHQAALIIPYYRNNNQIFVKQAIETINEILIDNKNML